MLFGTEFFEFEILKSIQNLFGCRFMDFIMPQITKIGNFGAVWISISIILLCTKKHRKLGFTLLLGLLLGFILGNLLLKNIIARPRPCWIDQSFPLLIKNPADFSFPSGHTLSSFISSFVIFEKNKKIGILTFVLASLISFSRLYLFVHFPTDIFGGILLAFVVWKVLCFAEKRISHKR